MSAQIVSFPTSCPLASKPKSQKADPKLPSQPPRPKRKSKQQREAESENRRKQELLRRWAELSQPFGLDPTYRAFHHRIDQVSVDLDLPYMLGDDITRMFLLMFENGAMTLSD